MNLQKLFETQAVLDNQIIEKHNLQGQDLLDKKILALQVELGELANEWRGFKFWSENQKPNTDVCDFCDGNKTVYAVNRELNISTPVKDCPVCRGSGKRDVNPLLEEYVDCLHFILSIGNDLNCSDMNPYLVKDREPIDEFGSVYFCITKMNVNNDNPGYKQFYYAELLSRFFSLGKSLGFDWEQIEQAYYDKNKVNHERQEQGY